MSLTPAACDSGVDGDDVPDAMTVSPSCMEAEDHSDLPWIQENILTPSCAAFSACHMGRALSAAELNLEDGMSEDNLVNVPSTLFPQFDLVEPGDPDNSYLMIITRGDRPELLTEAGTMPFNNPVLCDQKLDAMARWIESLGGGDVDAGPSDAGPSGDAM